MSFVYPARHFEPLGITTALPLARLILCYLSLEIDEITWNHATIALALGASGKFFARS